MIFASTGSLPPTEPAATVVDAALVLLMGATVIVLMAQAVARWCRSAWVTRSVWQTALLALWLLLLVEATGAGSMVSWAISRSLIGSNTPQEALVSGTSPRTTTSSQPGVITGEEAGNVDVAQRPAAIVGVGFGASATDPSQGGPLGQGNVAGDSPDPLSNPYHTGLVEGATVFAQVRQSWRPATDWPPPLFRSDASVETRMVEVSPIPRRGTPRPSDGSAATAVMGPVIAQTAHGAGSAGAGLQPIVPAASAHVSLQAVTNTSAPAESPNAEPLVPDAGTTENRSPAWLVWWAHVLGLLWCFGAVLGLVRIAAERIALWILCRRHTVPCSRAVSAQAEHLARTLGVRRPVFVGESERVLVPMAFGTWRPRIVVPEGFEDRFSEPERRAVLAHEVAHLANGDPAWMLGAGLLLVLLWWHPAVWYLRGQLRKSNELVADEAARLVPGGPVILAQMLVQFGRWIVAARCAPGAQVAESAAGRSALGHRVRRLLNLARTNPPHATPRPRRLLAGVLAVSVSFSAIVSSGWVRTRPVLAEGGPLMKSSDRLWYKSLVGLAVLGCLSVVGGGRYDDMSGSRAVAVADDQGPEAQRDRPVGRDADRPGPPWREGARFDRPPEAERPPVPRLEALERERNRLADEIERLEARLRELGDSRPEQAEEVRNAIRRTIARLNEVKESLDRARAEGRGLDAGRPVEAERGRVALPDQPGRHSPELMRRQRAELEEEAAQLRRKLEEVAREHPDQAEQIERRLREIGERMEQIGRPDGPAAPSPERIRRHLETLKEQLAHAEREGMGERADQLRRQIAEIVERMERGPQPPHIDRPPHPPMRPEGPPEEIERRVHHLKAAIENLHAAGLPEQAEMVERVLRRLRGEPVPDVPPGPGGPPGHVMPPGLRVPGPVSPPAQELFPQVDELHRAVGELSEQLRQMRDHMEQMQRAIHELNQRQELHQRAPRERDRREVRGREEQREEGQTAREHEEEEK